LKASGPIGAQLQRFDQSAFAIDSRKDLMKYRTGCNFDFAIHFLCFAGTIDSLIFLDCCSLPALAE
jgi:hypothetical protein